MTPGSKPSKGVITLWFWVSVFIVFANLCILEIDKAYAAKYHVHFNETQPIVLMLFGGVMAVHYYLMGRNLPGGGSNDSNSQDPDGRRERK